MNTISCQIRLDSPSESPRPAVAALDAPRLFRFGDAIVALKGAPRFGGTDIAADEDALRILNAYRGSGAETVSRLQGPFALVIVLSAEQRVLIAIDRMGIERLAWGRSGNLLAIGSSPEQVARTLSDAPRLDLQAVFDYTLLHMIPAPLTVYQGVRKLGPGTAIEFSNGSAREFRHWNPSFERPRDVDVAGLAAQVRPSLLRAIERSKPDGTCGSFLSGGLDSSTVTGLLAQSVRQCAGAFSVGFGVAEYDEMEYADAASRHFGCRHYKHEVTADDIVEAIPKIAATFDEPFGNSSAVPTYFCARLACEHGVSHLQAGDGGDELFGGNERYVRQRVFERYGRIPRVLRTLLLEPAADRFDPEDSLLPLRKFSSYVRQARIPLPERYESWNLVYREGPARIFSQPFLAGVEPEAPLRRMAETWKACPSGDLLDRMLWYDWKYTLADNDLRKVSTMCDLAGVDVSYPMLEDDFVELSIRVPSDEKISGGELRTFFRQAVRDFLPARILQKQKHGFGLPFGQWLKSHKPLQELVYASLDSLNGRGLFDPDFLKRVVDEHREGHPSYYGYAIWDLVMLEQWFQHHVAPEGI